MTYALCEKLGFGFETTGEKAKVGRSTRSCRKGLIPTLQLDLPACQKQAASLKSSSFRLRLPTARREQEHGARLEDGETRPAIVPGPFGAATLERRVEPTRSAGAGLPRPRHGVPRFAQQSRRRGQRERVGSTPDALQYTRGIVCADRCGASERARGSGAEQSSGKRPDMGRALHDEAKAAARAALTAGCTSAGHVCSSRTVVIACDCRIARNDNCSGSFFFAEKSSKNCTCMPDTKAHPTTLANHVIYLPCG